METQSQRAEERRVYTRRNQRPLYEVKEEQREEDNRKRREEEIKRIRAIEEENRKREAERQKKIRELEEYRFRLQIREEELIKERQQRLAAQQNASYIISSVGWQSRKRRV